MVAPIRFTGIALIATKPRRVRVSDHNNELINQPVVGIPDQLRGEIVKAFVVLNAGVKLSESLAEEMRQLVKKSLSAHVYPRKIEFVEALPKTVIDEIESAATKTQDDHGGSGAGRVINLYELCYLYMDLKLESVCDCLPLCRMARYVVLN